VTSEDPFVFPKAFVWCSKGLGFKREGVHGNAISLFLFVGSCGSRGGICNLLSCLRRSENWWHSKVIFSLSLFLSLRFLLFWMCVCVCVCWLPRSSNHQFLSSSAIYSFTVFFLVSSSSWLYSLLTFRFTLHGRMWRLCRTLVKTGLFLLPLHSRFVSDELRICLLLQSHCTLVIYNYNLWGCQQYLCLLVFVSTKYLGKAQLLVL